MELLRNLLHRSRPEPEAQGPLYVPVRDAMSSVQAYARTHGGEIELVRVNDEGDVTIRLLGLVYRPLFAGTLFRRPIPLAASATGPGEDLRGD